MMIGTTLGHYRIVEKIGEGGMGEVYRAHDERLDRDVAIKVLPEAVTQDAGRLARFETEAKAVAKLAHPNILDVFELGEHNGRPFMATELLEGQNLRQAIPASGMPWQKVVEIGAAIADGLAAAHGRGIVHRDLKPENVFITSDGRVKVLDFGLARVKEPVEEEAETAAMTPAGTVAGTVMGTMGYMSPEQLRGESSDARSDIFALGCVLYEMLSGQSAFLRKSTADTVAAILKEELPGLSDSGTTLPVELERAVRRCLEKSPDARFQSAADLAFGLRSIGTGPAAMMATPTGGVRPVTRRKRWWVAASAVGIAVAAVVGWELVDLQPAPSIPEVKHVAVLPFEAAGEDPESQFLAAGLAETVADGLTIMERETRGAAWVIAPSTELTLENARTQHNATIGVRGIFTPGVDRVRLDLELVDIDSGKALLHRSLDENARNITSLQKEPVLMVWEMLGFEATPAALEDLVDSSTNTLTACRAFVSGRGRLSTATDEAGLQAAVASLEVAVEEDPAFLPARVALAEAFARLFKETKTEQWKERAIAEAGYAIRLDADSPEPYLVLGKLHGDDGETELQLEAYRQAAKRARTAGPYLILGDSATDAGEFEEAEKALQTAINLRPDSYDGYKELAYLYYTMNSLDAATNQFRNAVRAAPENSSAHVNLGAVLYLQDRRDEAMEAFEDALALGPNTAAYSNLGTLYFEEARFGDATEMFESAVEIAGEDISADQYNLVANLASAEYWSGEREKARASFKQAIELGESFLEEDSNNQALMADLASYYGMVGEPDRGIELLEVVTLQEILDPYLMGTIAESYEDLGKRDLAVEWIGTALNSGLAEEWIKRRPSFNRLRDDDRFKSMLEEFEVE